MSRTSKALIVASIAWLTLGCSKDPAESGAPPAHSAPPAALSSAKPVQSEPPPTASAAPAHQCPKGSSGEGTSRSPCEASGDARMMEAVWTGKLGDDGPSFRVTNTSDAPILYGKIAVYFYDKAGKQLEVPDPNGNPPKPKPFQVCSGARLFAGTMKPGEKAVVTFSCVQEKHVPEGTAAIEAEVQMVGFADATETKSEYYWENKDLAPDVRPKRGSKKQN